MEEQQKPLHKKILKKIWHGAITLTVWIVSFFFVMGVIKATQYLWENVHMPTIPVKIVQPTQE